jgi:hypothetical protein
MMLQPSMRHFCQLDTTFILNNDRGTSNEPG